MTNPDKYAIIIYGECMIRIGLGISTYNRKESLENLIESIRKYTTIPYTLFCAVDGSNDGTVEMLINQGIEFTYGQTIGLHINKNRIFRRFSQFNFIFILEDNVTIKKEGWIEEFISASSLFNLPHIICDPRFYKTIYKTESMGNYVIDWVGVYNPIITFYTRRVVEKIGGIDDRLKGLSPGLLEHYSRIIQSKLINNEKGFPNFANSKQFIDYDNIDFQYKESKENIDKYYRLYQSIISENKSTGCIYKKL